MLGRGKPVLALGTIESKILEVRIMRRESREGSEQRYTRHTYTLGMS
jgi:hypothetical protein